MRSKNRQPSSFDKQLLLREVNTPKPLAIDKRRSKKEPHLSAKQSTVKLVSFHGNFKYMDNYGMVRCQETQKTRQG